MDSKNVKIVVFVPVGHADAVRKALAESGSGGVGNYDFCSFSVRGVGRFRPLEGAEPFVGDVGRVEEVEEERIETICPRESVEEVVKAVREAHPYEEPAIDIFSLLDV